MTSFDIGEGGDEGERKRDVASVVTLIWNSEWPAAQNAWAYYQWLVQTYSQDDNAGARIAAAREAWIELDPSIPVPDWYCYADGGIEAHWNDEDDL